MTLRSLTKIAKLQSVAEVKKMLENLYDVVAWRILDKEKIRTSCLFLTVLSLAFMTHLTGPKYLNF
jgi:hypothetical protein